MQPLGNVVMITSQTDL